MSSEQPPLKSRSYFYIEGDDVPPIPDSSMTAWSYPELDTQSTEQTQVLSHDQNINITDAPDCPDESGNPPMYSIERMGDRMDSREVFKTWPQEYFVQNEQYMLQNGFHGFPGYQPRLAPTYQYEAPFVPTGQAMLENPTLRSTGQYLTYQNNTATTSEGYHHGHQFSSFPVMGAASGLGNLTTSPGNVVSQSALYSQTTGETAPSIPSDGWPDYERRSTVQLPQQNPSSLSTPPDDREKPTYTCRCGKTDKRKDNYKRHLITCKKSHLLDHFICVCGLELNASSQDMISHIKGCNSGCRGRPPRHRRVIS
ncbi:hypothetical protein F4775DRAFT_280118 [Biscogniauxia sp. FL1348]|nr:hypothetical protein F4775DRAFT_280118 [Biscogniauxia sp. FL1348]